MISIDPNILLHASNSYNQYSTIHNNHPFHIGEIAIQQQYGVHDHVMTYGPKFIRNYMPIEHQQFYTDLPFIVTAIRDNNNNNNNTDQQQYMWATLLERIDNNDSIEEQVIESQQQQEQEHLLITSPTPKTLHIHTRPVRGDALEGVFDINDANTNQVIDVGLLGIQFETARRNRVNGRIYMNEMIFESQKQKRTQSQLPLLFHVDQSFGNCPQYIKPRQQWYRATTTIQPDDDDSKESPLLPPSNAIRINKSYPTILTQEQIEWINTAETFFTATGYRDYNDVTNQDHMRYGNDASHRGGPPGFVHVEHVVVTTPTNEGQQQEQQQQEIVWTEYNGNNFFNSLGNLIMDDRIGLCFPNFDNGSMLQISGIGIVDVGSVQSGERQVHVQIKAINEVPIGSLPIRWGIPKSQKNDDTTTATNNSNDPEYTTMQITKIIQESKDVKSFYIQPTDTVTTILPFQAGQNLPIQLVLDNGEVIDRRYSLSSNPTTTTTAAPALSDKTSDGNENYNKKDAYYRISVKYHPHGKSSTYLHNNVQVGSTIKVGKPGGTFVVQPTTHFKGKYGETITLPTPTPIVLVSAGIGITPLLSMLHELTTPCNSKVGGCGKKHPHDEDEAPLPMIYWFHGARDKDQHPFQDEIHQIYQSLNRKDLLQIHTLYSKGDGIVHDETTTATATAPIQKVGVGRITTQYITDMVPDIQNAFVYICGPSSFIADISSGLEDNGGQHIYYETF